MAQQGQRLPANEYGYAMCRTPDGRIVQGPVARGTPNSVTIPISCPRGSTFIGLFHTHPQGVSQPSGQDVRSGVEVAAQILCIRSEAEGLRCWQPR